MLYNIYMYPDLLMIVVLLLAGVLKKIQYKTSLRKSAHFVNSRLLRWKTVTNSLTNEYINAC